MKPKILYCASTASHILNFHLPYLQYFKEQGFQVDVAVGTEAEIPYADNIIVLPLKKSLFAVSNFDAVRIARQLLKRNSYDIVSIHTTLAGAIIRLAIKINGQKTAKVIYTSHGYFFNGNDNLREKVFLSVEKYLSSVTDILMVMNSVDYKLAVKYKLGRKIKLIPGMGLDISKFSIAEEEEKKSMKIAAGFAPDDFLLIYAAEMSKRKNHGELIRAFSRASEQEPSLKLLLAGEGKLRKKYENMVQSLGLNGKVFFLGYVSDMSKIYRMCDAAVTTSRSEGLPFNVMEAMACGLPVIASRIKGHVDLLGRSKNNALLYDLGNEKDLSNIIKLLCANNELKKKLRKFNRFEVQYYELNVVKTAVIQNYSL